MQVCNSARLLGQVLVSRAGYMTHHSEGKGEAEILPKDPLKALPSARKLCGQRLQRAQPCRAARAGHDGPAAGRASQAHQPRIYL